MRLLPLLCLLLLLAGCQTSPPARDRKIYLIIDDAGQSLSKSASFFNLPVPLTIAVLPNCPHTKEVARTVYNDHPDKELILHQPMEPLNPRIDPGPGAIRIDTPVEEIASILEMNMAQVPGAKGMNNHMGSRITQDPKLMEATMAFCKKNNLFFIDSLTTPDSVAGNIAREMGVPTAQQSVFLDNDKSEAAIQARFEQGMEIASRCGFVVMIGHTWSPNTVKVIRDMAPAASRAGFTFHIISDIF